MQDIEITGKRIYIKDPEMINKINEADTTPRFGLFLKFNYEHDIDGSVIIFVKILQNLPDRESRSNGTIKLNHTENSYWFYTPEILKQYIGKKVAYRIEKCFTSWMELMRIKPIDFKFNSPIKELKQNKKTVPYFTKSGSFSIPKTFLSKNFNYIVLKRRIVFSKTLPNILSSGMVVMSILPYGKYEQYGYFLKSSPGDFLSIAKPHGLLNNIYNKNKKPENFKYHSISTEENGEINLLFMEDECLKNQN